MVVSLLCELCAGWGSGWGLCHSRTTPPPPLLDKMVNYKKFPPPPHLINDKTLHEMLVNGLPIPKMLDALCVRHCVQPSSTSSLFTSLRGSTLIAHRLAFKHTSFLHQKKQSKEKLSKKDRKLREGG